MANGEGKVRPFRYTRGKLSVELTFLIIFLTFGWRFATWGLRRCKPIVYHPIGLAGLTVYLFAYIASPWAGAALLWAVVGWALLWPDSYLKHAHSRTQSFLAGFLYRHRPRRKLEANGLLNDKDPIPTI